MKKTLKNSPEKKTLYKGHDLRLQGDSLFIDLLLPENTYAYHMDTWGVEGKNRFQGSFFRVYPELDLEVAVDDPPLEVLKAAHAYSVRICTSCNNPHLVWTLWFA